MTLPTNIILPLQDDADTHEKELVFSLQGMYEDIVLNVNGDTKQFTPTVSGTTAEGTGNYVHQTGWYLRQGIMVDLWFDVQWSSHTGTGNLFLNLPYKVFNASTTDKPFVGVLQPDTVTFATGTAAVINAISSTFRGEIWEYGSGIASVNIAIAGTGQLIGHIRYVGTQFER